jgi:anti-sigma-K factor RskA
MKLTCEEVDEILAAFAIDALPPDEREAVIEHLADCRRHDAELADHRAVLIGLAGAAQETPPPPGLRTRLLADFDDEVQGRAPIVKPTRIDWWRRPQFAYGLAAALLIAVIGLGAWNLSLRSGNRNVMVRNVSSASGSLSVVYMADHKLAIVEPSLPRLPEGRAYQAWLLPGGGGAPVSLGMLAKDGPTAFSTDLGGAAAIAVSVEPAGGSPQPTTTPVVVDPLG